MARIAGVNIPTAKRVEIGLQYIHGIGPAKAKEICGKVGIELARRVNTLSDDEVIRIRETIDRDYTVEGDLRREVAMNIKRLMDLACYRGLAASPRPAGPWPAHAYQCAHPQGSGQADRRQEESHEVSEGNRIMAKPAAAASGTAAAPRRVPVARNARTSSRASRT